MKFCEALDRFVRLRRLSPDEMEGLLENARISNKRSYQRLVVTAVVVDYLSKFAPGSFGNDGLPLIDDKVEESLYDVCVKLNPELDINRVTIKVAKAQVNAPSLPILKKVKEKESTSLRPRYESLKEELEKSIIGQPKAIEVVTSIIRKSAAGLRDPKRPIGAFIFVGQTGVGKTELAKVLSRALFDGEDKLLRIDCSEYAMAHEYAKLIGAPPGYVGHEEGGILSEALLRCPERVVLFDEIEKANSKVHNLLLQIFDEGMLCDSKGRAISFTKSIVILTSNIGVEALDKLKNSIGFRSESQEPDGKVRSRETQKALAKVFPPEFLNRIDEVVLFKSLQRDDEYGILALMIEEVASRCRELGFELSLSAKAREHLVEEGTDRRYGARPLRRAIQREVENPIADLILEGRVKRGNEILVGYRKKARKLIFNVKE